MEPNKLKVSECLIQSAATFCICFLACQSGFVCAWPSYTTAMFRSNDTVLNRPMTSLDISLLGGLPNVGGLLICPFCSYIFNTFGRKYASMVFGVPFVITWIMIVFTSNVSIILLAITIGGIGIAGQNVSLIYIAEISNDSIRGCLTSFSASGYYLGLLFSYMLGGYLNYMQVVYIHLGLSVLSIVLLMLLKESPAYYVLAGNEEEAAKSISFYRRLDVKSKEVEAEIAKIKLQLDPRLEVLLQAGTDPVSSEPLETTDNKSMDYEIRNNETSWKILLKSKSSQRALVAVLIIMSLTIMMGCIVIQVYAEPLFIEAVPSMPPNLCAVFVALDFLVASIVCAFLVDKYGRKFLLIATASLSGVCCLFLGAQLQFHWAPASVTAMLIYAYSFVYTAGCGTIPFVLAAEVFLPEVRSLCNSVVLAFVWIFNFVTLVIFNPLVEWVGLGPVFYLFSAICFAGAVYSQFYVPETKGLSVTDIQKLFLKSHTKNLK